jgi:hypothetical protein
MTPSSVSPLGAVVEAGRGQLRLQLSEGGGESGGALLERDLGGGQLPGGRQDRLVQGNHRLVERLGIVGGPAQAGRATHQAEQVRMRVRAKPLRLVLDLP